MIFISPKKILIEVISRRTADDPITLKELAAWVGICPREISRMIHQLRVEGIPILSNGKGYFYSENSSDIKKFVRQMKSRICEINAATRAAEDFLLELGGEV